MMKGFGISLLLFALGISPALHKMHAVSTTSNATTLSVEEELIEGYTPKKVMGATSAASADAIDYDLQKVRKKVFRSTGGLGTIRSLSMQNSISSDLVSISFQSTTFQKMKVEIFDHSGKKIFSWDEMLSDGPNKITFNKKYIASGIYFLSASTEEGNLVRKFMN